MPAWPGWSWARSAFPRLAFPWFLGSFISSFPFPGRNRGAAAKASKGKLHNVVRDLLDPRGIQFQFGPESRDHVAPVRIVDHLSDHAVRREPDLVVVGIQIEQEPDQFAKPV